MNTSWIKKYILPKEIDFLSALDAHAAIINKIIDDLEKCFLKGDESHCMTIINDQHRAGEIRDRNMKDLLNVFITPIDRESIYRVITELDWSAISIRHFALEAQAYGITFLDQDYGALIHHLKLQSALLSAGFKTVKSDPEKTAESAKRVRETYDAFMYDYIKRKTEIISLEDAQKRCIYKELLFQLHDVSKRLRMTADSLEDIIMKMS